MMSLAETHLARKYVMGLLAVAGISVYGLTAFARGVRGESLFVGNIALSNRIATIIGLILQLPLIGYVLLGYLTGTFAILWRAIRAAP